MDKFIISTSKNARFQVLTSIKIALGDALMMEEVNISQTSANFYQTTHRNIPEDSHLHV
jgi:hypothetical protein